MNSDSLQVKRVKVKIFPYYLETLLVHQFVSAKYC